jgi:hypothetical protein
VAFDEENLFDVGELGWGRRGQDLYGVDLLAAVASVVGPPADRGVLPGEGVELVEQARLVTADGQHVIGAAPVQVSGMFALRVHHVGADHDVFQGRDLIQ